MWAMSVTFAVLALPFWGTWLALEFYGPMHGSEPWMRRLCFAAWLGLGVFASYLAGAES
jgi:hypothetical protein